MKRIFGILLTVLVILLAVCPYIIGLTIKHKIEESIARFNQHQLVNLTITDYQVGWLTSDMKIDASYLDFYAVTLISDIQHGPIVDGINWAKIDSRADKLTLIAALNESIDLSNIKYPLFEIEGWIKPDGVIIFKETIQSNEFSRLDASTNSTSKIRWSGMTFSGECQVANFDCKMTGDIDSTEVLTMVGNLNEPENSTHLMFKGIGLDIDISELISGSVPKGLFLGDIEYLIDSISVAQSIADQQQVVDILDASKLKVNIGVEKTENIYDLKYLVSANSASMLGYQLNNPVFNIDIENINEAFLIKYMSLVSDISANQLKSGNAADIENQLTQKLVGLLPDLLVSDPKVKINKFYAELPEGVIDADMEVQYFGKEARFDPTQLRGSVNVKAPATLVENLFIKSLYNRMIAQFGGKEINEEQEAALKTQLSEIASSQIAQYLEQGMLIREGDSYHTSISIEQGLKIKVNGLLMQSPPIQ